MKLKVFSFLLLLQSLNLICSATKTAAPAAKTAVPAAKTAVPAAKTAAPAAKTAAPAAKKESIAELQEQVTKSGLLNMDMGLKEDRLPLLPLLEKTIIKEINIAATKDEISNLVLVLYNKGGHYCHNAAMYYPLYDTARHNKPVAGQPPNISNVIKKTLQGLSQKDWNEGIYLVPYYVTQKGHIVNSLNQVYSKNLQHFADAPDAPKVKYYEHPHANTAAEVLSDIFCYWCSIGIDVYRDAKAYKIGPNRGYYVYLAIFDNNWKYLGSDPISHMVPYNAPYLSEKHPAQYSKVNGANVYPYQNYVTIEESDHHEDLSYIHTHLGGPGLINFPPALIYLAVYLDGKHTVDPGCLGHSLKYSDTSNEFFQELAWVNSVLKVKLVDSISDTETIANTNISALDPSLYKDVSTSTGFFPDLIKQTSITKMQIAQDVTVDGKPENLSLNVWVDTTVPDLSKHHLNFPLMSDYKKIKVFNTEIQEYLKKLSAQDWAKGIYIIPYFVFSDGKGAKKEVKKAAEKSKGSKEIKNKSLKNNAKSAKGSFVNSIEKIKNFGYEVYIAIYDHDWKYKVHGRISSKGLGVAPETMRLCVYQHGKPIEYLDTSKKLYQELSYPGSIFHVKVVDEIETPLSETLVPLNNSKLFVSGS